MVRISFPGNRDKCFFDAINVLEECKVKDLPCCGFENEFMSPGGYYKNCWWERDSTLTLSGYKWIDQEFAEKALENFISVQKENGRIPLGDAMPSRITIENCPLFRSFLRSDIRSAAEQRTKPLLRESIRCFRAIWRGGSPI